MGCLSKSLRALNDIRSNLRNKFDPNLRASSGNPPHPASPRTLTETRTRCDLCRNPHIKKECQHEVEATGIAALSVDIIIPLLNAFAFDDDEQSGSPTFAILAKFPEDVVIQFINAIKDQHRPMLDIIGTMSDDVVTVNDLPEGMNDDDFEYVAFMGSSVSVTPDLFKTMQVELRGRQKA